MNNLRHQRARQKEQGYLKREISFFTGITANSKISVGESIHKINFHQHPYHIKKKSKTHCDPMADRENPMPGENKGLHNYKDGVIPRHII